MNTTHPPFVSMRRAIAIALVGLASTASAFDSGSTGADGAFHPQVSTQVSLPPNGVLNYTSVTIPIGVNVTFAKNTTNTPVVILASGDVKIDGRIDVSGANAPASGAAGDGNVGDDGVPGTGGPGGYDGGRGGKASAVLAENISGAGQGPGGAGPSKTFQAGNYMCGGGGAGFGAAGSPGGSSNSCPNAASTIPGTAYGQPDLLPLIGGSGGAGGSGLTNYRGAGGGGGGGALLIAASGTLTVNGDIRAIGGKGGASSGQGSGGAGGSGSGGAIRLIATTLAGNGILTAVGGTETSGTTNDNYGRGGAGAVGRIRLEAESISRNSPTTPPYTFGTPGPIFVAGLPTLRVQSVAGVEAPAAPTGNADIALPEGTQNPVTVVVATTGVPLGNTVKLVVTPANGAPIEAVSTALSGTEENAGATAQIALPTGPSTLLATVSYSVPEDSEESKALAAYTDGEPVTRVELATSPAGSVETILHTQSGRHVAVAGTLAASGG